MSERELSCFFVRESLPLYIEARLKPDRFKVIQAHIAGCKECAALFKNREEAKVALLSLSKTECSPEVLQYLRTEHNFWQDFRDKYGWKQWNSNAKWAAELALVGVALAVTVNLFPWLNLARTFKGIDIQKEWSSRVKGTDTAQTTPTGNVPIDTDMEGEHPPIVNNGTDVTYGPQLPPGGLPAAGAKAAVLPAGKTQLAAKISTDEEEGQNDNTPAMSQKGFVWRGAVRVEVMSPELVERIKKLVEGLGGTKAGKVELGWRNEGGQPYFHFLIPAGNYDKLLSSLNTEGFTQLKKENHPRVIKQGYMRVIMTIEEEK